MNLGKGWIRQPLSSKVGDFSFVFFIFLYFLLFLWSFVSLVFFIFFYLCFFFEVLCPLCFLYFSIFAFSLKFCVPCVFYIFFIFAFSLKFCVHLPFPLFLVFYFVCFPSLGGDFLGCPLYFLFLIPSSSLLNPFNFLLLFLLVYFLMCWWRTMGR